MSPNNIEFWASRILIFVAEAHAIFGTIESSSSRNITLDDSYSNLAGLSLQQDEIFRQALRCVENQLYRAAHVMAWAGLADCLQSLVASDAFTKLNAARPNWHIASIEQLAETHTEHALIEALFVMNLLTKPESKAMFGMLSKRNECAHPGTYFPTYNETLGYISEIFSRLGKLMKNWPDLKL